MNKQIKFDLTLAHFTVENDRAVARRGVEKLGLVEEAKLRLVLEIFRQINPVQDFDGEPQVIIAARGGKWAVSSDLHRLILYDLKRLHLPGEVLSTEQIIGEVGETAAEGRRALSRALAQQETPVGETRVEQESALKVSASPLRLIVLSLASLSSVVVALVLPAASEAADFSVHRHYTVTSEGDEQRRLAEQLAGVYMAGNSPGSHGISLLEDGAIKFFELRRKDAPLFVNDLFQVGRSSGKLYVLTSQLGGPIEVLSKDQLRYCGELYVKVR